ncbi:MAG: hypothetical protein HGA97_05490 [Chlorobiaceae bacterium]|jgi:hypothetical protein|nr:hypothetical protein [Chlorobiaceae bacterium]
MKGFLFSLLIASMVFIPSLSRGAMIVREFTPTRHDRFFDGSTKDFVGATYDFSGVGTSTTGRWATLLSDNCFLSALHLHPEVGEKVTFWATNTLAGPSHTYTVTGGMRIGMTDLWVGWFDKSVTVDPSIARYPVPRLTAGKEYLGWQLFNYGLLHRVGRNVLDKLAKFVVGSSTAVAAWYDYDNKDVPSTGGDETYLEGGDSGAPSFAVLDSELFLIGIHWGITSYKVGSIDTFVPAYFYDINKVLAERGQSLCRRGKR